MKHPVLILFIALLSLGPGPWDAAAAVTPISPTKPGKSSKPEVTAASLLEEAQSAFGKGDRSQAMSLVNRAVRLEPGEPRPYFARARLHTALGDSAKAIEDFNKVLTLNPAELDVYHLRGVEHFISGHILESVRDFNQYLALDPSRTPQHWQRGIALYYADQFEEGRKQFEQHQTVNAQDVENSAWHYFCVARLSGSEKARALLLPVTSDTRVPMMQIQALLAGTGTPEQVLEAASASNTSAAGKQRHQFYAHLYLGLYYEVHGDEMKSREHIDKALPLAASGDYMGKVALVHAKLRKEAARPKGRKS